MPSMFRITISGGEDIDLDLLSRVVQASIDLVAPPFLDVEDGKLSELL